MNARLVFVPLLALSVLVVAVPAGAQSLADVARKEAERRGATQAPGKTYTNESLTPDFTKAPEPAPAPAGPTATVPATGADATTDPAAGGDTADAAAAEQDGVTPRDQQAPQPNHDKGEDFWRARANRIRSRLNQQNAEIAALQKQAAAYPDGAANPERELAVRALRKAQDDVVELNQEWLRFERQARERNVPDAWIR